MHRLLLVIVLLTGLPVGAHAQARSSAMVQLTVIEAAVAVTSPVCLGCDGMIVADARAMPTVLLRWEDGSGSVRDENVSPRRAIPLLSGANGRTGAEPGSARSAGAREALTISGLAGAGAAPAGGVLTMMVIAH